MQRWILAGFGAVLLMMGGGFIALKQYRLNQPAPMWVPLPVRQDLPLAEQDKAVKDLKAKLCVEEVFLRVSKDLGLPAKWKLATDKDAAAELGNLVFVRTGQADTPMGKVPAIHIGVNGKARDRELSGRIAVRLMDDVWSILGVEPPPKKKGM
jgi:hypothetical protein